MWFLPAWSYKPSKTCGPAKASNTKVVQRSNNGPNRAHDLRRVRRRLLKVTPRPWNAAEEAQRGTSSEETRSPNPPASNPAPPSESRLIQQGKAAEDLRLPVVDIGPPNEQTTQVLDSEDIRAVTPPTDPALSPQAEPVTPPLTPRPEDELQQRPSEKRDREIETRTRRRTPSSQKPEKAAKLQRSYNINKKRTMQKILGQRSPGCTIPIQRIENHFEKHMVGDNIGFSPDPDLLKEFAPKNGAQLEESISSNEV
ncbi:hypothetical protein LAZ67_6003833 [Cordylochernes scorpioides]|uniref:Uncharacterized protein n=1 Tax=Cordylochernes scorpioides TaxID=51811 RepID=A0ABY6KLA5_9ARAC|nr:hypothetical protein LAZ67_6003833 [Cordylochernes scorpioides]